MAGPALIVRVDALRSIAFGSITGSFTVLGSPFAHAIRILKITNTCDKGMFISFDGTTTNDYVAAGGFFLYDLTTNGIGQEFVFQIGTQIYIKYESAPGSGNVYVSCIYGQGQ